MTSSRKTSTTTTPAPAAADRIETARLAGEPLCARHDDELCRLLGDPRVGATLGGMKTPGQVRARIAQHEDHWRRHGFGQWLWRLRADGAFAARGGLQRTEVDGTWETEVGWAVVPELWRRGYATELGAAAIAHAFEALGLDELVAFTLPDNVASRRVMEKLGFEYEKDFDHAGLRHVLYRLRSTVA